MEFSDDPRKIDRLIRFCKENGLKDEAFILKVVKVQQSSHQVWKGAKELLKQTDRTTRSNLAWLSSPPVPMTSSGPTHDVEIILLQIGHYSRYYCSQLSAACFPPESRQSAEFNAKDLFRLLFFWKLAFRALDFWTLIDHDQFRLRRGETWSSAAVLNSACDLVRALLIEEEPMLIPCVVSIFTDQRHYWSNEVPSLIHGFLTQIAATMLGKPHEIITGLGKSPIT